MLFFFGICQVAHYFKVCGKINDWRDTYEFYLYNYHCLVTWSTSILHLKWHYNIVNNNNDNNNIIQLVMFKKSHIQLLQNRFYIRKLYLKTKKVGKQRKSIVIAKMYSSACNKDIRSCWLALFQVLILAFASLLKTDILSKLTTYSARWKLPVFMSFPWQIILAL